MSNTASTRKQSRTASNGLQTLTKSVLKKVPTSEEIVSSLLKKDRITKEDLYDFTDADKALFSETVQQLAKSLKAEERDDFFLKIDDIVTDDTKRGIWETNHFNIVSTINTLIKRSNRMPTKTEIADEVGISRQTVHKHLNEYSSNPLYANQLEQHKIMGDRVLTAMYQEAIQGNVKAAKLYLQVTGFLNGRESGIRINSQTNYIQVNGTVINEEALKQLPPEQLNLLCNMVKGLLPGSITSNEI